MSGTTCRIGGKAPLGPPVRQLLPTTQRKFTGAPVRRRRWPHVFRLEMGNPLAPHSDERLRRQLLHRFPRLFDGRKRISPDRAPAPFFALLPAFAGGAHRFPGDAIGLAEVLRGAFPALLMDQVEIVQVRLPVRHPLEQNAFGDDLVGRRNGIIAGIENVSEPNLPNSYLLSWNSPNTTRCVAWGRNRTRPWPPPS